MSTRERAGEEFELVEVKKSDLQRMIDLLSRLEGRGKQI
jgi:predicted AAA+ superfamily ATPase